MSTGEVANRLGANGPNALPHPRTTSPLRRLPAQLTDLFAVILLVAPGITAVAHLLGHPRNPGTLQLAVAILAVVGLNAAIGFGQEYTAERTAEALRAMVPHQPACYATVNPPAFALR